MFSRHYRINSRVFTKIFKKGTTLFSSYLRLTYFPHNTHGVSVVIPKKIIARRVGRNREKRRITHLLKEIVSHNLLPNAYYIFWVKKNTEELSSKELFSELTFLTKKIPH